MRGAGAVRWANTLAAAAMVAVGIAIVVFVFPHQIPEGLPGDVSSGHYPKFTMAVWILSAALWLVQSLCGRIAQEDESEAPVTGRSILVMLVLGLGYALFALLGFLCAGFFLILSLSFLTGERGMGAWLLAAIAPPAIYVFLDVVLEVTLPTIWN